MLPILTLISLVAGVTGGMVVASVLYDIPYSVFLDSVQSFLDIWDIWNSMIKAVIFGGIIAIVGSSWGLTTAGGAKGVGQSTTAAVVTALLSVFMTNFFLSWLMFQGMGGTALQNL